MILESGIQSRPAWKGSGDRKDNGESGTGHGHGHEVFTEYQLSVYDLSNPYEARVGYMLIEDGKHPEEWQDEADRMLVDMLETQGRPEDIPLATLHRHTLFLDGKALSLGHTEDFAGVLAGVPHTR